VPAALSFGADEGGYAAVKAALHRQLEVAGAGYCDLMLAVLPDHIIAEMRHEAMRQLQDSVKVLLEDLITQAANADSQPPPQEPLSEEERLVEQLQALHANAEAAGPETALTPPALEPLARQVLALPAVRTEIEPLLAYLISYGKAAANVRNGDPVEFAQ